jgi:hypothetical protein
VAISREAGGPPPRRPPPRRARRTRRSSCGLPSIQRIPCGASPSTWRRTSWARMRATW